LQRDFVIDGDYMNVASMSKELLKRSACSVFSLIHLSHSM